MSTQRCPGFIRVSSTSTSVAITAKQANPAPKSMMASDVHRHVAAVPRVERAPCHGEQSPICTEWHFSAAPPAKPK
eukprot:8020781-Pyramimonas_sp.AAC.1